VCVSVCVRVLRHNYQSNTALLSNHDSAWRVSRSFVPCCFFFVASTESSKQLVLFIIPLRVSDLLFRSDSEMFGQCVCEFEM
jgi:hypothetical protein